MPIRNQFTEEGLVAVTQRESQRLSSTMFEMPQTASVTRSVLYSYDFMVPLLDSLEDNLGKFFFAAHSIEEWNRRYCYPNPLTIKQQLSALGVGDDDLAQTAERLVINRNPESIRLWVERELIARRRGQGGLGALKYVLGTVGSGKSSLNKYITTVHFETFKAAKVVPSRVECLKFEKFMQQNDGLGGVSPSTPDGRNQALIRYLKLSLVRDIIHQTRTEMQKVDGQHMLVAASDLSDGKVSGSEFRNFVADALRAARRSVDDLDDIVDEARRLFDIIGAQPPSERGEVSRQQISTDVDEFVLDAVLAYFQTIGYRFCLLFDGFDYIQATDFNMDTLQTGIIDALARWIVQDECKLVLIRGRYTIEPNVTLTIRRNTSQMIGRLHKQIYNRGHPKVFYVLSPSMRDMFSSVSREISRRFMVAGRKGNERELRMILIRSRMAIKSALELQGMSMATLFNGNVRHQVNYAKDVVFELANEILRDRRSVAGTTPQLIGEIGLDVANWMKRRRYRLIDRLLFSANQRFANFVTVRPPAPVRRDDGGWSHGPIAAELIQDNDFASGYVGNILNYHTSYLNPGDEAFLLEKIRIVQLIIDLGRRDRGRYDACEVTEKWLRERFAEHNWPVSPYFETSLGLLVREGMLEIGPSVREATFSVLPLGRVAAEQLIQRMVYLENVYFGTLIPEWMRMNSEDVSRTINQVDRWVTASFFHVWLLLRLIQHAERIGADGDEASYRFILPRMLAGVQRDIQMMVEPRHYIDQLEVQEVHRPAGLANDRIEKYKRSI